MLERKDAATPSSSLTEIALRPSFAARTIALLSFGTSTCCFILGIFFAVSGSCYYFLTRKRKDSV